MSFLLWRDGYEEGFCKITVPQGVARTVPVTKGTGVPPPSLPARIW
jgi:hypothetical protein